MELLFELRDGADKPHGDQKFNFTERATVKELQAKICDLFSIEPEHQVLSVVGKPHLEKLHLMPNEEVLFNILEKRNVIIVKHMNLPWWALYYDCVEKVRKHQKSIVDDAKTAVEHHKRLMKSGFSNVYAEFEGYRLKYQSEVASWADGVVEIIANAAENHFLIQHGRRGGKSKASFKFEWNPRSADMRGTRGGIVANVQLHGEGHPTKFSIKNHHYGSTSFNSKGSPPDIIELFSYKLLELLKIGPAVQFIFPSKSTGAKTATYIASTWRDDFIRLCDLSNENDFDIEALIQLRLLHGLLFIGDLHGDNCGQWNSTKTAAIVDLCPLPYANYQSVKKALRGPHKLTWDDTPLKMLSNCSDKNFWNITKKCLDDWNLLAKIDQANELIVIEKEQMKSLQIEFRGIDSTSNSNYTVTNELDDHLNAIKANLETLLNELKSVQ